MLAVKIERNLTKNEILELYINQIYLGQRAFGFGAASKIYFGKPLSQATLAEIAMMAGLPKAPSKFNPVVNFKRAKIRQNYILDRMFTLGFLSQEEAANAKNELLQLSSLRTNPSKHSEFFVEMVRRGLIEQWGDDAYTRGFNVHTTLSTTHQEAAFNALKRGLENHDRRQGFRGAIKSVPAKALASDDSLEEILFEFDQIEDMVPAVILDLSEPELGLYVKGFGLSKLPSEKTQYGPTDALLGSETAVSYTHLTLPTNREV